MKSRCAPLVAPERPPDAATCAPAAPSAGLSDAAHAAFEHMPLGCVIVAPDFTVVDWNPAAERILGFAKADVVGRQPFGLFVAESMRAEVTAFLAGIETDAGLRTWVHRTRTRAGGEILCEWQDAALRGPRGELVGILGMFTDVSERERSRCLLEESEGRFRALVEQSLAGIYMLEGRQISYVNHRAAEIFGYTRDEAVGRDFIDAIAQEDRARLAEQFAQRISGDVPKASYAARAVRKDGREIVIGVSSSLTSIEGRPFIIGMLQDITEREQARQRIRDHRRQLEESMLATIRAVTAMIEQRDPYTAGHERRVSELASAIGRELGLPDERCRGLQIIGTVHDIGKNAIPVEVLNKQARLSDAEFDLIRTHARAGYEVLKDVPFPWPVADAVLQHHERLDGSGYPQGLKGEQIVIEARIIAVADVVEAMATHRPYRAALGLEKALEEITQFGGTRYDADAVAACVRLFRERQYVLDSH
jgi:PAS domain S-box-containing protein